MTTKPKTLVWFGTQLVQSGGGERLSLEVVRTLKDQGYEVHYVVYNYDREKTFDGHYDFLNIVRLEDGDDRSQFRSPIQRRVWNWQRRFWLRRTLKRLRPDIVITTGTWNQVVELHLATLGMSLKYGVHVFGSLFAFRPEQERSKYARVFRKSFEKIRNSVPTYIDIVPATLPLMGLRERLAVEKYAWLKRWAIRRAEVVWALTNRNAWETKHLYGCPVKVLNGAFPESIFRFQPSGNLRDELGLPDRKLILSICRLVPNKRVDLCIQAFTELARTREDVCLIIGGTGPEEEMLRSMVKSAKLTERVRFIGHVPEERLFSYYCGCDVVVHLDLADFDIAPLEALALGVPVIWADEMDLPEITSNLGFVYEVPPDPNLIAKAMEVAIDENVEHPTVEQRREVLDSFTWEQFSRRMMASFDD